MLMSVEMSMKGMKTTALELMLHEIEDVKIGGVPEEMQEKWELPM